MCSQYLSLNKQYKIFFSYTCYWKKKRSRFSWLYDVNMVALMGKHILISCEQLKKKHVFKNKTQFCNYLLTIVTSNLYDFLSSVA